MADGQTIKLAGRILREGGTVIFPTETVYGLGANALDSKAIDKIYAAKGRPSDNPLIVHVTCAEDARPLAAEFPDEALKLFGLFSPGPLTIVMKKSALVPDRVSGGLDTVAVRIPAHPVARAIIAAAGVPVAAPSANISGRPSPTCIEHLDEMRGRVDLIVDGGPCEVGVESTVVSLCGEKPRLLRPGAVGVEQLREALGGIEIDKAVDGEIAKSDRVSSPGMKYRHYAPKCRVYLLREGDDISLMVRAAEKSAASGLKTAVICFDDEAELFPFADVLSLGSKEDLSQAARRIFSLLRRADELGAEAAFASSVDKKGVGLAVYNRMLKAAGHQYIKEDML